nr:Ig-like domain-containing protein [uncultured Dongia sp.]
MAQLVKIGKYLVEIDGTHLAFFDVNGNQLGLPQDLNQETQITLPDGSAMPVEQLTEMLADDPGALANFETAAGAPADVNQPGTEANSGGGRFATFEDQEGIGGLNAIGGLKQTESATGNDLPDDGEKPGAITQLTLINVAPTVETEELRTPEDTSLEGSVVGADADGDNLTYILVEAPQHGVIEFHNDGTFTYTPDQDYNGPDSFTYKANDGISDSNVASVDITVQPVNDLPVADDNSLIIAEDSVVNSAVTGSDAEGDALSFNLVGSPQHGTLAFNTDGTFTYTPDADFNGADSFTYRANDGTGNGNIATITIDVRPENDLPVSEDGAVTLAEDSIANSSVHATDVDGDSITYSLVDQPKHGSIVFHEDGSFTYTPDANYNGADAFTYKANDGHGNGNVATIALKVTPVDDAPVVTSQGGETDIHITRVSIEQNPFGDSKVGDYLAAGGADSKAVNPSMINGVNPANLTLTQAADVKVSFVSEGAGYKSMVGTYTFDAKGNIDPASVKFLWLDATQPTQNKAGGALQKDFLGNTQPQDISLGNLAADTKMGFFIIADGASQSDNTKALAAISGVDSKSDNAAKDLAAINQHVSFVKDANGNGQILLDGKALSGNVYFTHDKTLNTDNTKSDIEHTLSGVTTKADGKLYVGFEDLAGGGDKDYDDVIIKVDIGDYNVNKLSQVSTQPSVHLSDIDSTHLSSAVVTTSGFLAGDTLNIPSSNLFTVTSVAHGTDVTYTITPKAGFETVGAFEDFLNHAFFSTSSTEDGHRTISYQVTDAEGVTSNVSAADVHVTSSYEISSTELNNLSHLGSGDDTLYLKKDFNTALDMGDGTDTVRLQHGNMAFGSHEAKLLDNVEVIDATGAGNNKVAISAADVLDMTDGDHHLTILGQKGDSLTLTGDGGHTWTVTDHGADFTTYSYDDGVHQAIVEVSNQMAQTVV